MIGVFIVFAFMMSLVINFIEKIAGVDEKDKTAETNQSRRPARTSGASKA